MVKADSSVFVKFFGDYPLIRVLDFLIEHRGWDYSKKHIAKHSDVAWNTLDGFWPRLEKNRIVTRAGKTGKAQMYQLNLESPFVRLLLQLDKTLIRKSLREVQPLKKSRAVKIKISPRLLVRAAP